MAKDDLIISPDDEPGKNMGYELRRALRKEFGISVLIPKEICALSLNDLAKLMDGGLSRDALNQLATYAYCHFVRQLPEIKARRRLRELSEAEAAEKRRFDEYAEKFIRDRGW